MNLRGGLGGGLGKKSFEVTLTVERSDVTFTTGNRLHLECIDPVFCTAKYDLRSRGRGRYKRMASHAMMHSFAGDHGNAHGCICGCPWIGVNKRLDFRTRR